MNKNLLQSLNQTLIVSCQAPVESPLHDPYVIAAMAKAAVLNGAAAVRIDTPAHITAVRQQISAPIIGLWKQQIPGYDVYITPQFSHAEAIAKAGADIIAIDATLRERPNQEQLTTIITQIHQKLGKLVMADIDTIEAAISAANAGADIVATTLYGYTNQTKHLSPPGFQLLAEMREKLQVPVICEGGISSPKMVKQALEIGAFAVVVGTDITGIDAKLKAYLS
ncbi:N-acetylmannosamine-6-phosphate 2-epimerase [Aerosakkonemataceae cyanobacterium BLCC-F154]|uniref:N-acylglucosamine-6-phosphate 2-epimerase n=1 Tax=Floridaenema fluviatile BLCC-F154 TaxID=3153640 RepID=A0ABV4Y4K6_9CYAN